MKSLEIRAYSLVKSAKNLEVGVSELAMSKYDPGYNKDIAINYCRGCIEALHKKLAKLEALVSKEGET